MKVGGRVGALVGTPLTGMNVGALLGLAVGALLRVEVGLPVGDELGVSVGTALGGSVGVLLLTACTTILPYGGPRFHTATKSPPKASMMRDTTVKSFSSSLFRDKSSVITTL
jgi:hypothetical protein